MVQLNCLSSLQLTQYLQNTYKRYINFILITLKNLVAQKKGEESVVVKGSVPKSLKLQFKALCALRGQKMSDILEYLIEDWIQVDAPVPEFPVDLSNEDSEDVKGYIPISLKRQFKALCRQKQVRMRFVLYQLINEWVQRDDRTWGGSS